MGCSSSHNKSSISPGEGAIPSHVKKSSVLPNSNTALKRNDETVGPGGTKLDSGLIHFEQNICTDNLFIACKKGKVSMVQSSMQAGCDINALGMWNSTPLIVACQYNHELVALELLEDKNINIHHVNEKGCSAMIYACLEGMGNVVKKFITMGVDINPPSVSVYNASTDKSDMYTPLSISIVNGHIDIVTMLIDHAQSHSISLMNHRYKMQLDNTGDNIYTTGITCLMLACRYGRYDVLSYLLEAVYSSDLASLIEALDSNNQTLFHHLSHYTSSNSSNKRILRDIFVNVINQYRTSNQSTTFANITALLEVRDSLCGDTCLHIACEKKNIEMVFCLTELSAISVNTVNNLNITPLFIAIKKRHEKIIRQLLSHGANPNIICGGVIVDESVVDKKNTSQGALMPISCYDEALKLPKTTAVYKLFVEFKQKQIEDANKISTECIENKTSIISLKEDDVREGSANVSEMSPTTHDNISNKWNAGNTNKDKIVPFTPIVSNSYNTSSNSYVDLTLSSVGIDQSSNNKGWSNNQPPLHVHKTISMQGGVLGNTLPGLKMGETTNRVLFDDNDTLELLEITGMTPRMDQ